MPPKTIIAIDPGASGAVVVRAADGPILEVARFDGWETVRRAVARSTWTVPKAEQRIAAVIERVWASPVMGVSSAFAFGENYGVWIGALRSSGIKVYTVTPQAWQRVAAPDISGQGPARKQALKALAQSRHPALRVTLATADALLISDYALDRINAGLPPGDDL